MPIHATPRPAGRVGAASVVAAVALTLAACGSGTGGVRAGAGQPAPSPSSAVSHPASAAAKAAHFQLKANCGGAAGAYDVTDAGTAAWAVRLPGASTAPPVAIDGLAAFGDGNRISALRLTDGSQAWQRTYPGAPGSAPGRVVSLDAWHGELIAVTGLTRGSGPVRVQALDPVTGAVRWTVSLGAGDAYSISQVITAGGVLTALIGSGGRGQPGSLTAFDLNARRLLWSRPWSKDNLTYGPVAAGSVIVMARSGTVTGLDARTGAVRWTRGGLPGEVRPVAGPGNLVLLHVLIQYTENYDLPPSRQRPRLVSPLFPVTALDATTGAVLWRAKTAGGVDEVFAGDGLIIVVTAGPGRLTLLRPGGQVIWSVPETAYNDIPLTAQTGMTWVDTGTDLIYVRDLASGGPTVLVDRRLSDGAVRWSMTLGGPGSGATVVRPAGGNLIVTEDPGSGSAPPTVLAVDPVTGHVRATARLTATTGIAPTVVGGDTLLEVTASLCL